MGLITSEDGAAVGFADDTPVAVGFADRPVLQRQR